jgi:hypothetical protein
MALKPSQINPGRVPAPPTTAHGKLGGAKEDTGQKRADGRNTTVPPPAKFFGTYAGLAKPGGSNPAGPGVPVSASTEHGKTPQRSSPDNSHKRVSLPAKGWAGSGGPNAGRGAASPGMKAGRGRVKPLIQPGSSREYAPNA